METNPSTDRWDALDFGPPPSDLAETEPSVRLDYLSGEQIARDHPQPAGRRQRHHDRDGRHA